MAEDGRPVALNVLVPSDTVANLGQHRSEGGFADIEQITSEVVAVQFDEVERVEEYVAIIAPPVARVVPGGKPNETLMAACRALSGNSQ